MLLFTMRRMIRLATVGVLIAMRMTMSVVVAMTVAVAVIRVDRQGVLVRLGVLLDRQMEGHIDDPDQQREQHDHAAQ